MILSKIILPVLAAMIAGTAAEWECSTDGGAGHEALGGTHEAFNRLFGNARLNIASGQCYIAACNGNVFGICNYASFTQWEVANHRNIAAADDPGSGSFCGHFTQFDNRWVRYVWSREDDINMDGFSDIRRC